MIITESEVRKSKLSPINVLQVLLKVEIRWGILHSEVLCVIFCYLHEFSLQKWKAKYLFSLPPLHGTALPKSQSIQCHNASC